MAHFTFSLSHYKILNHHPSTPHFTKSFILTFTLRHIRRVQFEEQFFHQMLLVLYALRLPQTDFQSCSSLPYSCCCYLRKPEKGKTGLNIDSNAYALSGSLKLEQYPDMMLFPFLTVDTKNRKPFLIVHSAILFDQAQLRQRQRWGGQRLPL